MRANTLTGPDFELLGLAELTPEEAEAIDAEIAARNAARLRERPKKRSTTPVRYIVGAGDEWWPNLDEFYAEAAPRIKTEAILRRELPAPEWDGKGLGKRLGARPQTAYRGRGRRRSGSW